MILLLANTPAKFLASGINTVLLQDITPSLVGGKHFAGSGDMWQLDIGKTKNTNTISSFLKLEQITKKRTLPKIMYFFPYSPPFNKPSSTPYSHFHKRQIVQPSVDGRYISEPGLRE